MTDSTRVNCRYCGQGLPLCHKGSCPNCGKEGKRFSADLATYIGLASYLNAQRIRRFVRNNPSIIGISAALTIVSLVAGWLLDGLIGFLIGVILSLLVWWLGPYARETFVEITNYGDHAAAAISEDKVQTNEKDNRFRFISFLIKLVSEFFFSLFIILLVSAMLVYFYRYISSLVQLQLTDSPLTLSAISIALGGFILLGAFYQDKSLAEEARNKELKKIAKLFLGAGVSFVITFLLLNWVHEIKSQQLTLLEWAVVYSTAFVMAAAGVCLSGGLVLLVRYIWRL